MEYNAMSNDNDDLKISPEAELASLKSRADMLGLQYHPSIGMEKLREKVNAAVASTSKDDTEVSPPPAEPVMATAKEETPAERRFRKKREANKLVRVRVICMNPAKAEWDGEIFTCGNSLVGSFTKYVPFNAEDGWHIPSIILDQMRERMCQVFVSKKDSRGNTVREGKQIREFGIEVMPDLTVAELQDLAQRQAMAKTAD